MVKPSNGSRLRWASPGSFLGRGGFIGQDSTLSGLGPGGLGGAKCMFCLSFLTFTILQVMVTTETRIWAHRIREHICI